MALMSGATHVLQWSVQWEAKSKDGANPTKAGPSSDCSLQLDYMKLELLVMACQQQRRESVPGPCTHRPSHHGSWFCPKTLT